MSGKDPGASTEAGPNPHGDGPLRRWARRRREVAREERAAAEAEARRKSVPDGVPDVPEPGGDASEAAAGIEEKVLTDADMPLLDSLDEDSDYSGFLSPGVTEGLRRRALRKLFASAVFNVPDGLDDYDEDFTSFEALGDIVTSDMKHQAEMQAERARRARADAKPETVLEDESSGAGDERLACAEDRAREGEATSAADDEAGVDAADEASGKSAESFDAPAPVGDARRPVPIVDDHAPAVTGVPADDEAAGIANEAPAGRAEPPDAPAPVGDARRSAPIVDPPPSAVTGAPGAGGETGPPASMSEMDNDAGAPEPALPATTGDGAARARALAEARNTAIVPAGLVSYASSGRLALIGSAADALPVAECLDGGLEVVILASPDDAPADPGAARILHAAITAVEGHLGAFTLYAESDGSPVVVAPSPLTGNRPFDIVIDLRPEPALEHEVLPPGYFAPRGEETALAEAIEQAADLVGEFEKPRYFGYDPDICAHGASGIRGCTRCLDACPTGAIRSIGERVEVDPYLCQGAGVCASACPTGAITYAYPPPSSQLAALRAALAAYREAGGRAPALLFHDAETGADQWARVAREMPESVVPWAVEEVGSIGLDVWTACIAWGARVVVLAPVRVPDSVRRELDVQIGVTRTILESMGYPPALLSLVADGEALGLAFAPHAAPDPATDPPAAFAPSGEKRTDVRLALDHLYEHAPRRPEVVGLPPAAPFGTVDVDDGACTLCMACVSVCPASALQAGGDEPRLSFIEMNCVQCGLCERACPESCIARGPRYLFDREARRRPRVLNEDQPFHCVSCGKVFGTTSVVMRMQQRLAGHSMFQAPGALARLRMCEDCRVKDMFRSEAAAREQG